MIKILLALLLSINLFAQVQDPYKNILYKELDNGLKVYLLSDKKSVNTQIKLSVNVGTSVEDETNTGISHLVEHLIFRDSRVPFHDYLDHLQDEGATFVNAYTKKQITEYLATIDADKSFCLVESFANMLFDKNLTSEDLRIEKRALSNEMGELKWYNPLTHAVAKTLLSISDLYPKKSNIS